MSPAILGYGCTSSAGQTRSDFWRGLINGLDQSRPLTTEGWPVPLTLAPRACKWESRACSWEGNETKPFRSVRELLVSQLLVAWKEALGDLDRQTIQRLRSSGSTSSSVSSELGVILASTKGSIDDFIWQGEPDLSQDPCTPILDDFLKQAELKADRKLCMNTACTSTFSAVFLALQWLKRGNIRDVLILATDYIGPFVVQGFHCLRAVTPDQCRPFAVNRSGLQLGEASAAILISNHTPGILESTPIELAGIGIDAEGYAVTQPSADGASLKRACSQILSLQEIPRELQETPPDLIIAHGTGTALNDPIEDQVFYQLFGDQGPLITGSKWSIGHTLGASGAMDLIAACETLREQQCFGLANTSEIDPKFRCRYLYSGHSYTLPQTFSKVLVTSLGFGGTHAAAVLKRGDSKKDSKNGD